MFSSEHRLLRLDNGKQKADLLRSSLQFLWADRFYVLALPDDTKLLLSALKVRISMLQIMLYNFKFIQVVCLSINDILTRNLASKWIS